MQTRSYKLVRGSKAGQLESGWMKCSRYTAWVSPMRERLNLVYVTSCSFGGLGNETEQVVRWMAPPVGPSSRPNRGRSSTVPQPSRFRSKSKVKSSLGQNQFTCSGAAQTIEFAMIVDPDFVTTSNDFVETNNLGEISCVGSYGRIGCWRLFGLLVIGVASLIIGRLSWFQKKSFRLT